MADPAPPVQGGFGVTSATPPPQTVFCQRWLLSKPVILRLSWSQAAPKIRFRVSLPHCRLARAPLFSVSRRSLLMLTRPPAQVHPAFGSLTFSPPVVQVGKS